MSLSSRGHFLAWGRAVIPLLLLLVVILACAGIRQTLAVAICLSALSLVLVAFWIFCWLRADRWRRISPGNLLCIWVIWFWFGSPLLCSSVFSRSGGRLALPKLTVDVGFAVLLILLRKHFVSKWQGEKMAHRHQLLPDRESMLDSWPGSVLLGLTIGVGICFIEGLLAYFQVQTASAVTHLFLPVSGRLATLASLLWVAAPGTVMLSVACFLIARRSARWASLRSALVCAPRLVMSGFFVLILLRSAGHRTALLSRPHGFLLLMGFLFAPVLFAILFLFLGLALHRKKCRNSARGATSRSLP